MGKRKRRKQALRCPPSFCNTNTTSSTSSTSIHERLEEGEEEEEEGGESIKRPYKLQSLVMIDDKSRRRRQRTTYIG